MTNSRGRPPHPDVLTPAEWRVIEHVQNGLTNREIADELGLSVNTVRYHVSNILAKLELRSRADARAWSGERRRWGWAALGGMSLAKVAAFSIALVASTVVIVGAISATSGGVSTGDPVIDGTESAAGEETRTHTEPAATSSSGDSADLASSLNPTATATRPTVLPLAQAAPTSLMCRHQSDQILDTFGALKTYPAIRDIPPELVRTGSPHWIDVHGCVVHAPPPDLKAFFAQMGTPDIEIPDQLTLRCLLSDPLVPAGTKVESIPADADSTSDRPEHRLVTTSGAPLPAPITVIAYCDMSGDGLRFGLSGHDTPGWTGAAATAP